MRIKVAVPLGLLFWLVLAFIFVGSGTTGFEGAAHLLPVTSLPAPAPNELDGFGRPVQQQVHGQRAPRAASVDFSTASVSRTVQTAHSKLKVPTFVYGTAWKKEHTTALVKQAIRAGFRAIDTANQAKHYSEALVGEGLHQAYAEMGLSRNDFWLQTKYSHGQWATATKKGMPYSDQVKQSVQESLQHLKTPYIDSLLLHGPLDKRIPELPAGDWESWKAMENMVDSGKILSIGISNCNVGQLRSLILGARIKPEYVQKRCFANTGWEKEIRDLCKQNDIIFQGYSILTANRYLSKDKTMLNIARRHGKTVQQIIFRFALQVGITPLTGSSSAAHLEEDLSVYSSFELSSAEISTIEHAGLGHENKRRRGH